MKSPETSVDGPIAHVNRLVAGSPGPSTRSRVSEPRSRPELTSAAASAATPASSAPTAPRRRSRAWSAWRGRLAQPVALLIVDHELREMTGVEFLAGAHALHPPAKRILLVERDYTAAQPDRAGDDAGPDRLPPRQAVAARSTGCTRRWRVSRELGALGARAGSACSASPRPRTAPRGAEIRDLLTRFSSPFRFATTDSRGGRRAARRGRARRVAACPRWCATTAGCSSTPATASWSRRSAAAPSSASRSTTSRSSVLARRGCRRPCTPPPKGSTRSCSSARSRVARRERARASATSRASPGASAATTSPTARASRRGCSARTWCSPSARSSLRACGGERILTVADGQEVRARAVVLAHRRRGGGGLRSRGWRSSSAPVCSTGPPRARPARCAALACASWAAATPPGRRWRISPSTPSASRCSCAESALEESMSEYLITELRELPNVSVRLGAELVDGEGDGQLSAILVRDRSSGAEERLAATGLFVMIGAEPNTEWLDGVVQRDEHGFILTGRDVERRGMAAGEGTGAARDERPGRVRRGRRTPRLGQARDDGDGRGRHGRPTRARVPRAAT